jgi:hypothetical protein
MPAANYQFGAANVDCTIYAIGGLNLPMQDISLKACM